tara:strand:- start:109 stop:294 length:186 start_codon:yes stop_codon:yes gene_type:complete
MFTTEQIQAFKGTDRAILSGYDLGVYDCKNGNAALSSGSQRYFEGYSDQFAKEQMQEGNRK